MLCLGISRAVRGVVFDRLAAASSARLRRGRLLGAAAPPLAFVGPENPRRF